MEKVEATKPYTFKAYNKAPMIKAPKPAPDGLKKKNDAKKTLLAQSKIDKAKKKLCDLGFYPDILLLSRKQFLDWWAAKDLFLLKLMDKHVVVPIKTKNDIFFCRFLPTAPVYAKYVKALKRKKKHHARNL